jgi:hypothetical protein
MKRAQAYLCLLYLIACLFGLLICEAWRCTRKRKSHGLRRV